MQSERTKEHHVCPQHFQDRLTAVGGKNRYGNPNFRLAWAQSETMRQGGEWEVLGEQFIGYRDVPLGDGLPHWMLLQWVDAGKSVEMPHLPPQSDVSFYMENKCPKTGLQILGGYPYRGSYQIALPLVAKWFEGNELKLHAFPLSTEIINMMVPIIKASMMLTLEAKRQFIEEEKEKSEQQFASAVEDAYKSVKLSNAARSSQWIQDKVRSLEKIYNASLVESLHRNRFFQSGGPING